MNKLDIIDIKYRKISIPIPHLKSWSIGSIPSKVRSLYTCGGVFEARKIVKAWVVPLEMRAIYLEDFIQPCIKNASVAYNYIIKL